MNSKRFLKGVCKVGSGTLTGIVTVGSFVPSQPVMGIEITEEEKNELLKKINSVVEKVCESTIANGNEQAWAMDDNKFRIKARSRVKMRRTVGNKLCSLLAALYEHKGDEKMVLPNRTQEFLLQLLSDEEKLGLFIKGAHCCE